jgi:hypothetical protein
MKKGAEGRHFLTEPACAVLVKREWLAPDANMRLYSGGFKLGGFHA